MLESQAKMCRRKYNFEKVWISRPGLDMSENVSTNNPALSQSTFIKLVVVY